MNLPIATAEIGALLAPIDPTATGDGSLTGLFAYIGLALGVSFFCSILEASLLSISQSHVEIMVDQGSKAGKLLQKQKQNVDRPISAILTLNTIAHTVGAAGAGAQAAAVFGSQYIGLISAVLTLLILVLSEIIPKTLGAVYWKQLATFTGYAVQMLVVVLYPAVWVFEWMTRLLRPEEEETTVTRADLEVLARISAEEGALLEEENRVVRNLLSLSEVKVEAIMTPRTVVTALQQDLSPRDILKENQHIPYSRLPIYADNLDDIHAYVLRHHILLEAANDRHNTPLKDLGQTIHSVSETASVADVLNEFIAQHEHIFLVIDEYGGTAGIITLEDTIETLLGMEITDESDLVEDLRQLAQERFTRVRNARTAFDAPTSSERVDASADKPVTPVTQTDSK